MPVIHMGARAHATGAYNRIQACAMLRLLVLCKVVADKNQNPDQPGQPGRPPRRKRYSGKNPRRFDQRYKELSPAQYPGIVEHVRARGQTPAGMHVPIMTAEVIECLNPSAGEIIVDCTLGYGGHAEGFLQRIGPAGLLIGMDVDGGQLQRTTQRLAAMGSRFSPHHSNFAGIAKVLAEAGESLCDVIFADLGVSSMQIDDPARGFSYKFDGPLDMRMDDRIALTAAGMIARLSEAKLSQALADFADEPDHEMIAREIVNARTYGPITRTLELVDVIFAAKGLTPAKWRKQGGLHPAARTFQALRILVNEELASLRELLRVAPFCLNAGGRIGILTFHSGEDRLVKHAFRDALASGVYSEVSPEPLRPGPAEIRDNPRSSPAKFRWAIK
jgi:16S rRNA (cytosine1402-N4)-methyltransferase